MRTRSLVLVCTLALPFVFAGCGNDDTVGGGGGGSATSSDVDRYYQTLCAKQAECGFLGGMTESQCLTACASNASEGTERCDVSRADADACFNAIGAATCDSFLTVTIPEECNLCPDDGGSPDAGTGTGGDATGGFDVGGSATGGDCNDLAACCPDLPEQAQEECNTTAANGNDTGWGIPGAVCEMALSWYRGAGLCP